MFWRLKKKSLQRRAWYIGSFLCRVIDEDVYTNVRHRLQQRCGGAKTRVKLSVKGWASGGDHNMPSQFYALERITAVQPDPLFANVLLCVFRRVDAAADDFTYETVAYKFDGARGPDEFHQLFRSLCPTAASRGNAASSGLAKKPSELPGRRTTGRGGGGKQGGPMPGRPTHGVMGAVAPDRWAARDRATPRLFASRSVDDLLDETASTSQRHERHRRLSADIDDDLDNHLPNDDDDQTQTSTPCSTASFQPVVLPADTVLQGLNGALDGAWWSADDEAAAATRTKDVGVAATFPDATDHRKHRRRAGLEFWTDDVGVACQTYLVPAANANTRAAVRCWEDDDDYDDDLDEEFKWVFGSDDEEEQPVFYASSDTAVIQVNGERTNAATSYHFDEDRVDTATATADRAAEMSSPSDGVKRGHSGRLNHITVNTSQHSVPAASSGAFSRRPPPVTHKSSSSKRYRVPGPHVVTSRHPSQHGSNDVGVPIVATTSSALPLRRVQSETSVVAARARRPGDSSNAGTAGALSGQVKARRVSSAIQRRRVQSVAEHRQVHRCQYAISH